MKCANCPLFTSWNTENDRGEACGIFGDAWDNAFQYEDKNGNVVGCYIDRHFIEKRDAEYEKELERRVEYFFGTGGQQMTNAEKLRQLTDDELACYLTRIQISSVLDFCAENFEEIAPPGEETRKELKEAILKVLQQEAPDD